MAELVTREDYLYKAEQGAYSFDWSSVPREFVDDDFVSRVVYVSPGSFERIPKEYVSQAVINMLTKSESDAYKIKKKVSELYQNTTTWANFLANHNRKSTVAEIPEELRNQELFDKAFALNMFCVHNIPEEFQTQEMWIKYAINERNPKDVPKEFKNGVFYEQIAGHVDMKFIPERYQSVITWQQAIDKDRVRSASEIPLGMRSTWVGELEKEEDLQQAKKALSDVRKREVDIFDVKRENQSPDMWKEYVLSDISRVSRVPREFQTQDMWMAYIREFPDNIERVPKEFRSRDLYERYLDAFPERVDEIPEDYQTFELWRRSGRPLIKSSDKVRTQEFWNEIIDNNPGEFKNMDSAFKTPRLCVALLRNNLINIKDVPESSMDSSVLETYAFQNSNNIKECVENSKLRPFLTSRICDLYGMSVRYNLNTVTLWIPEKFQTEKFWDNVYSYNHDNRLNILRDYMPKQYQTQEMWSKLVELNKINESHLEDIPSQFREEIKDLLIKKKQDNQQRSDIVKKIQNVRDDIDLAQNIVDKIDDVIKTSEICSSLIQASIDILELEFKIPIGVVDDKTYTAIIGDLEKISQDVQKLKEQALKLEKETPSKEEPIQKNEPVENKPPVKEEPVVKTEPVVDNKEPVAKTEPIADVKDPVVKEEPADKAEPVSEVKEPVAKEEPAVAVEEPLVVANEPVADVKEDENFEKVMKMFSEVHANYYDGKKGTRGNAHTKEEIALKNSINRKMKKYLQNQMGRVAKENNLDQAGLVEQLSNAVSKDLISQLVENKGATLKLMEIMASGVFIRNGERIRLSQKQRIALADTMAKVSEQMLQKDAQNKNKTANAVENLLNNEHERE